MKNIHQAIASSYPFRVIAILGIAALIGACEAGNDATYNSYDSAESPRGEAQEEAVTEQLKIAPSPAAQPQSLQDSSLLQNEPKEVESGETYAPIEENPFYQVSSKPLSTFAIDVDAASYSNVRRFINEGQKPPQDAVRIEELINYFNYEYPQPEGDNPFSFTTEIS
ncbi:MAG: hypothetical protein F6K41_41365, partial [Symploca sp. SIO3E6]|nr:hypothetical protein [Caldora sp. SIO3E6]